MAVVLSPPQAQDISVRLTYLKRCEIYKAIRPYTLACKVDDEFPTNNLVFEEGPLEAIQDIRGLQPGQLTVEKNGFAMIRHDFKNPNPDEGSMDGDGGYLDEVRQLVRDTLINVGVEVDRVEIINYVFRTAKKDHMFANADISGRDFRAFAPDTYVHNDCNFHGGDKRIRAMLGAEADEILASKRVRLINVWKPINNPIEDCNLAICDASTVQHDKCIHGDFIVTPDYISQTNYAAPCKEQKWYWVSNQRPDEVILFKQHDTDESSNTRYCPHTAFWRNDPRQCSVPRESIEVRTLIVSPK